MAWIELHQTVPTHRKTIKLKRLLNVSRVTALGHLAMLWLWALDNVPGGDVTDLSPEDLSEVCDWDGDPATFKNALIESGYVDPDGRIHDWDDYAGRLIDQREAAREKTRTRVQKHRAKQKDETCNGDVTRYSNASVTPCNAPVTPCNAPTVPNRTQPNRTQPNRTQPHPTIEANASCLASPTTDDDRSESKNAVIQEIVAFLNLTIGANYRPAGAKTREKIIARLNEGYALDDFKKVILKKHADWGRDPERAKFLRPETLFGLKFESYLNQPDTEPALSVRGALAELYHEAKGDEP